MPDVNTSFDIFPATVASIINPYKVVINRGTAHGVKEGDRFLIYELTDEIIDPQTTKSLGRLELSKGTGRVIHIQDRLALIESDRIERTLLPTALLPSMSSPKLPFDNPAIGDLAIPIQA